MKLSLQQIRGVAAGHAAANEEQGAIRFDRMPPLPAALYQREPASRVRLECPSGVRLRFRSRTRWLGLSLRYGEACRPHYQGALLVDGGDVVTFGPDTAAPAWSGEITVPGGGDPRLLELWLPHLARADLVTLEIDDDCEVEPVPPTGPRWLACGDSITQGMTAPLPTQTWAALLALKLDADLLNWGIGGATMDARLGEHLDACAYDLLTVAYGTNDFMRGVPPDVFAGNARQVVARQARSHPRALVCLITPIPWAGRTEPNPIGCTLTDYRNALAAIGNECSFCRIVEGPALIPDDPAFFVDNVHPNARGMALYASNLQREILPLLTSFHSRGSRGEEDHLSIPHPKKEASLC